MCDFLLILFEYDFFMLIYTYFQVDLETLLDIIENLDKSNAKVAVMNLIR